MYEYIDWFYSFRYITPVSYEEFIIFLVVGILLLLIDWYSYLKFVHLTLADVLGDSDEVYSLTSKIVAVPIGMLGGILGVFEELVWRAPILYLSRNSSLVVTVPVLFLISFVFMISHKKPNNRMLYHVGFGGLIYGVSVIVMDSLWPAMIAHFLWNFSTIIIVFNYDLVSRCARALQR